MSFLIGIVGVLAVFFIVFVISNDKKNINYRAVIIMFALQLALAWFMLNTNIGEKGIGFIAKVFSHLLSYGNEGINFVAGGLVPEGKNVFVINVLMMIIFISTILNVLTYTRILPLAIKWIGGGLAKITGLPMLESFSAVNSMIFGDTAALIAVKSFIPKLSNNRLFILCTASMTSVSVSIIGAYMAMIPAEYVFIALPLNVLSGLIVTSIAAPVKKEEAKESIQVKDMIKETSLFEAIGNGAIDGGRVAVIVAAILVAYVGLLALVNGILMNTVGVTFQTILGYIFYPISFLMGIPHHELLKAGSIMGTKVAANEFVAMLDFMKMIPHLSEKTVAIVSTFLISFANFASIGIIGGTLQAIDSKQSSIAAKFGLKMLFVATLASVLTGTIVGLFV
ncbi:NupC/NupG family nucleoside CNT transporter [Bacillus sp. 03113]|uniref:NupC/NupG family nucleoside CNT transporter n=1 Tax=Bacillus sp. 03113 TaxID=2578211 RepID=UPI0011437011|nr:nucleoside transporter C-terminal domain-containing protein [Bacillus sp. 03113]